MLTAIAAVLVVALFGWIYQAIQPPRPRICGTPNGPPVTSPRIRLRDGRYLAYKESGTPKDEAKYKVIIIHGFGSSKEYEYPFSQDLVNELGIYFLQFDRAGYGESDPNPKRMVKSEAMDIEELADQLELGSRFYVLGGSMGGYPVWSCLNYIPHRLAGAGLVAPPVNYWWPSFPADLVKKAYKRLLVQDQRTIWIAHYVPSLMYAWMSQKWFPTAAAVERHPDLLSPQDKENMHKRPKKVRSPRNKAQQQSIFESLHRDIMVLFSNWEFDPMKMRNPFPNNEGTVYLWQGYEDRQVQVELQRYVAQKLPWIRYHEHPKCGHTLLYMDGWGDAMLKALVLGEEFTVEFDHFDLDSPYTDKDSGMLTAAAAVLLVVLLGWAYQAIQPPPPRICGAPNGPPVTSPRIKLRDGRYLAYKEAGITKEKAKYKVILVHGFGSSKDPEFPASQELVDELGVYFLSFDRAGYGESDPNPKRTVKSEAMDIQELADQLELGSKFYVIGASMGGYPAWSCLNYIPHRLAGVALVAPAVNYWWPSFPANLSRMAYKKLFVQDQRTFWIAHHFPSLLYGWMSQKWLPTSAVIQGHPELFTPQDMEIMQKMKAHAEILGLQNKAAQQSVFESLHRDIMVFILQLGV
ncbi:uncharacterized protein LOC103717990 [Phoenix dactylifera]|uniref:Uncharacterized protein LOC103717990 n=1 Tax=Phoenix dactylifera TaxID=42345 RepID=A0A8B8ZLY2_PHODC|nr:uncharacterized protein LOC103717990 [Phoenix dactylifera]